MNAEYENIIQLALDAMRRKCAMTDKQADIKIKTKDIVANILGADFICLVKPTLTAAVEKDIYKSDTGNTILITKYVNPDMMDRLIGDGVNFMDACGNFYVRHYEKEKVIFHLANRGEKNLFAKNKVQPMLHEAGLKLVFFLLQQQGNVSLPYRNMQEATGISLGSIKNILDALTSGKYIIMKGGKRLLKNTDALVDAWITEFSRTLKPKLLLGRMSFRNTKDREDWKAMQLPEGMYWGGECGANIVDGYLTPGSYELYSEVAMARLMQSGKVRMDAGGEIAVYRKFWPEREKTNTQTTPIFLLYADLLVQGGSRCIEAAERLKDYGFDH